MFSIYKHNHCASFSVTVRSHTIFRGCGGLYVSLIYLKGNDKKTKILAAAFSICLASTMFYYFSKKKIPCSHVEESANKNKVEKRKH